MEGKKMRDALEEIVGIAKIALNVNCVGNSNDSELWDIIDKCKSALSAPARQCDVGTPEEQEMRFSDYCRKHYDLTFDLDSDPCKACPFFAMPSGCRFAWAQTPYEAEEGAGE